MKITKGIYINFFRSHTVDNYPVRVEISILQGGFLLARNKILFDKDYLLNNDLGTSEIIRLWKNKVYVRNDILIRIESFYKIAELLQEFKNKIIEKNH